MKRLPAGAEVGRKLPRVCSCRRAVNQMSAGARRSGGKTCISLISLRQSHFSGPQSVWGAVNAIQRTTRERSATNGCGWGCLIEQQIRFLQLLVKNGPTCSYTSVKVLEEYKSWAERDQGFIPLTSFPFSKWSTTITRGCAALEAVTCTAL